MAKTQTKTPIKKCPKCGLIKTIDEFHKGSWRCKLCVKTYYIENYDHIKKQREGYRSKNMIEFDSRKKRDRRKIPCFIDPDKRSGSDRRGKAARELGKL